MARNEACPLFLFLFLFDKALGLNRERIERVYRGNKEQASERKIKLAAIKALGLNRERIERVYRGAKEQATERKIKLAASG